jgi:hypothetical protein
MPPEYIQIQRINSLIKSHATRVVLALVSHDEHERITMLPLIISC